MATCLVTVTGTSGTVIVNYVDSGSDPRTIIAGIGQFYLDDDGTDYEWSTLSGDAAAASGCITLTEVPVNCYLFSWERPISYNPPGEVWTFNAVEIGTTVYNIDSVPYPYDKNFKVADNINALGLSEVKATAYKKVTSNDKIEFFLILRVLGTDIPYLRMTNLAEDKYLYLKGETSTCLPAGFTEIETCEVPSPPPLP